jgi:flagellar FliL protein
MATSVAAAPKAGAAKGAAGKEAAGEPAKKSKKKLIIAVVLVVAIAGGAAWFFLLRGSGSSTPKPPEAGAILKLDSISVNLADGHFLKVGIALQATKAAPAELEGSKALDIAIAELSGRQMSALAKPKERERVKQELVAKVSKAYDGEVMDLYFTDFVMQ